MASTFKQLSKRLPRTIEYAEENGWRFDLSGRHPKIVKEGRGMVTASWSPSCWRADNNLRSLLRQRDRQVSDA